LYDAPVNRYVADFVGESNLFAGPLAGVAEGGASVRTPTGLVLSGRCPPGAPGLAGTAAAVIAVRPEAIRLWPADGAAPGGLDCRLAGRVQNRIYLGDQTEYSIGTAELGDVLVRLPKAAVAAEPAPGDAVALGWRAEQALALVDQ